MKKEVAIIIKITEGKTFTLGFTNITVDTEDDNIPSLLKENEVISVSVKKSEHLVENETHTLVLYGIIDEKPLQIKLAYPIENNRYMELCKILGVSVNSKKLGIRFIKLIIDEYDPFIFIDYNE